ncbi:hypothetical protein FACS189490_10840 [Clostridia bacterium]|nr:hypothetical protein FACS189490_10840 [Clostridia bacterium]
MEEYRANSHRSKEDRAEPLPEKKVEKVISGEAKVKKKNEARKFADVFLAEDIKDVKSYIVMDVLVPTIKKAVSDVVTKGIDMVLYGGTNRNKNNSPSAKVSYRGCYEKENERRNYTPPRNRTGYILDDVSLDTRGEAESVLSSMDDLIAAYGIVSVADFYDLIGVNGNYTDNKYGWTDIRSADVVRARDGGYVIKLPKAMPLN